MAIMCVVCPNSNSSKLHPLRSTTSDWRCLIVPNSHPSITQTALTDLKIGFAFDWEVQNKPLLTWFIGEKLQDDVVVPQITRADEVANDIRSEWALQKQPTSITCKSMPLQGSSMATYSLDRHPFCTTDQNPCQQCLHLPKWPVQEEDLKLFASWTT